MRVGSRSRFADAGARLTRLSAPSGARTRAPVSGCWRDQPLRELRDGCQEEGTGVRALGDDTTQLDEVAYHAVPLFRPQHQSPGKQVFELAAPRGSCNPLKIQRFGHPY